MYSKLFHKDVFIPQKALEEGMNFQKTMKKYYFSKHFIEHLENNPIYDHKHKYLVDIVKECLTSLVDNPQEIFELEYSKGYNELGVNGFHTTKFCVRIPYDEKNDLVVAIRPQIKNGQHYDNMVVTAWLNNKYDKHFTLDKNKYCSLEEWNYC